MKSSASKSKPFQSRSKLKGEIPGLSFSFFFFMDCPSWKVNSRLLSLTKIATIATTRSLILRKQETSYSTTHLGGSDVVCVHNMDKMGWVVESPMNYTIECCHGDACLGLSESRRFVEPSHSIWRSINVLLRRCSQPTTEKVAEPVWKPK